MVSAARWATLAALGLAVLLPVSAPALTPDTEIPDTQIPDRACRALAASPRAVTDRARAPAPEDLVTLADIGDPSPAFDSAGLSVSPDRRYLAFPIRRASLVTNDYCLGIVLLDLSAKQMPRLIDAGRELVLQGLDVRGTFQPDAYPAAIRPAWSPDGNWIVFQKRAGGVTQLWRASVAGGAASPVAGTAGLSEAFRWLGNDRILVASRAGLAEAAAVIAAEAASGFRYDERFLPLQSDRPLALTPRQRRYHVVNLVSGTSRPADDAERALLEPVNPEGALRLARGRGGALAWTSTLHPDRYSADTDLQVTFRGGRPRRCAASLCNRIDDLWWMPGQDRLIFLRREGWANSRTGLYAWRKGERWPTRILVTDDLLLDCQPVSAALVCGHEAALKPRSIVSVRLRDGAVHTLYDPNPGFSRLSLGRAERLHWTNANGLETFGDLVYPVGFVPGKRYPTIVTTYTSRGFLRGATGDEYPIQLFANHGYAVLSFARPLDVGINMAGVPDAITAQRIAARDWSDRRSVQSSIEEGLRLLDRKGVVDRSRVGITGLSDGATTVQFALLNSRLFAAAALSSCCAEPESMTAGFGLGTADFFRGIGYPSLGDPLAHYWAPVSLTLNARRMRTPLLMQLGSGEFRAALSSYTALRAHHQPAEMYVFADEGHIKLQPVHRLAVYQRNLAWFDFWLKDERDTNLVGSADLLRWEALRSSASAQATKAEGD